MGQYSWVGGIINTLFNIGNVYEHNKLLKNEENIGKDDLGKSITNSQALIDLGAKTYERYKANYQPVGEGMATRALQAPEYDRAEGKVSSDISQQSKQANDAVDARTSNAGINPASGNFQSDATNVAAATGAARGYGFGAARYKEDQDKIGREMTVVGQNKGIPAQTTQMLSRTVDMNQAGAARAAGRATAERTATGEAAYGFGKAVTGSDWSGAPWNKNSYQYGGQNLDKSASSSDDASAWQNGEAGGGNASFGDGGNYGYNSGGGEGWADGGLITGPGDGRSDSIPASIDDTAPARVANGEYRIPDHVVQSVGKDKLDALRASVPPARGFNRARAVGAPVLSRGRR